MASKKGSDITFGERKLIVKPLKAGTPKSRMLVDEGQLLFSSHVKKRKFVELRSRQVKIRKGSLSDLVNNWEDVNKTLNGTEHESFLRADY